jgi:hypothetical protein
VASQGRNASADSAFVAIGGSREKDAVFIEVRLVTDPDDGSLSMAVAGLTSVVVAGLAGLLVVARRRARRR